MKYAIIFIPFLWYLCAVPANAEEPFHRQKTEAEKALDAILKRSDADEVQLDNLLHRYGPVVDNKRVDYSQMLTKSLITSMVRTEKRLSIKTVAENIVKAKFAV
jgi:CBS-domain-containing membrane protein